MCEKPLPPILLPFQHQNPAGGVWNVEYLPTGYRKAAKKTQDGKTQDTREEQM